MVASVNSLVVRCQHIASCWQACNENINLGAFVQRLVEERLAARRNDSKSKGICHPRSLLCLRVHSPDLPLVSSVIIWWPQIKQRTREGNSARVMEVWDMSSNGGVRELVCGVCVRVCVYCRYACRVAARVRIVGAYWVCVCLCCRRWLECWGSGTLCVCVCACVLHLCVSYSCVCVRIVCLCVRACVCVRVRACCRR